jgi:hypothetical protein
MPETGSDSKNLGRDVTFPANIQSQFMSDKYYSKSDITGTTFCQQDALETVVRYLERLVGEGGLKMYPIFISEISRKVAPPANENRRARWNKMS